jgi:hypothetical protein
VKVDYRNIAGHLASLAWVAVRAFVGTIIVLTLAGVVLAGLSSYFLREHEWWYGVGAAVLAIVEAETIGVLFGAKRAMVMTIARGLGILRLGAMIVGVVFERMLGIAAQEEVGERGGRIVQNLERLPFAQAEALLSGAVRDLTGDAAQAGWLRRKIQAWLLELVRKYTLARFRAEGAKHGGIDLLKVKDELEQTVDDALVQKVRGGLRLWTLLIVIGLPVAVALQTWVLHLLVR